LHGTGGRKEGMRSWLNDLAARGMMGVAIDARYHGDRSGGAKGSQAYVAAIAAAWRAPAGKMGHPVSHDTRGDPGGAGAVVGKRGTGGGWGCWLSQGGGWRRGWPRRWRSAWRWLAR